MRKRDRRWLARPGAFAVVALGLCTTPATAQEVIQLLRDIRPGNASSLGGALMLATDDYVLFDADDGLSGPALWRTDGTPDGTELVIDIFGPSGSFAVNSTPAAVGPLAYFALSDGFVGLQAWRSDGTMAGTIPLTSPTMPGQSVSPNEGMTPFDGGVAFHFAEHLWLSDGEVAGTMQAPANVQLSNLPIANVDNQLLVYGGYPGAPGQNGMIRSNGTLAGTALLAADVAAFQPTAVNGRLFFVHATPAEGNELWVLDAGASAPRLVRDIVLGFASSGPERLTRVDDRLFFTANEPSAGRELWVSDGSEGGTVRVRDIVSGVNGANPRALVADGGTLYFAATTPEHGTELWRSDGTHDGTVLVLDYFPGTETGLTSVGLFDIEDALNVVNRRVFFGGRSAPFGFASRPALLATDGASATELDSQTFFAAAMVPSHGKIVFPALRSATGTEPHAIDALALLGRLWCSRPERALRDGAGVETLTIRLPEAGTLYAAEVSLDLGHQRIGDLEVDLVHRESTTRVNLLDHPGAGLAAGGCLSDLVDIRLADAAAATADASCALAEARLAFPRDSTWRPAEPLSALNALPVAGHWDLEVRDTVAGEGGTLHEWCLSWSGPDIFADGFEDEFSF